MSGVLRHLKKHALGRLRRDDGKPDEEVIQKSVFFFTFSGYINSTLSRFLTLGWIFFRLFNSIDGNNDEYISATEMRAFIVGVQFDEVNLDQDAAINKVMSDFDTSHDERIDFPEFVNGISKWLGEAKSSGVDSHDAGPDTIKYLDHFHLVCHNVLNFCISLQIFCSTGKSWKTMCVSNKTMA